MTAKNKRTDKGSRGRNPDDYFQGRYKEDKNKKPFGSRLTKEEKDRAEKERKEILEKIKRGAYRDWETDRKSTRLNSSHRSLSRMPSSA